MPGDNRPPPAPACVVWCMRAAAVIPPHCPSCRAPVTLACPNLTEALIVCSDEAVRPVPRVLAMPG